MFDTHVYISTVFIDIDEMDLSEDPSSLPSENLRYQISSSPTYILEALGAIPPELLPTPVVEVPIPNFASTVLYQSYPVGSFFSKYEPQPTDGLPFSMATTTSPAMSSLGSP